METAGRAAKDLKTSAYMLILDDSRFAQLDAERPMPAASSIKTPVLLASLELIDNGDLHWNEPLTLTKELVGGGAGWMASKPVGSRFPTYEVATEMIRVSDNSATNLMIERVGGQAAINARFQALGLPATEVNNWLPDLDGTNTTSARDLSRSIALVDSGETLSPRSRDLFREVMSTSITDIAAHRSARHKEEPRAHRTKAWLARVIAFTTKPVTSASPMQTPD